MDRLCGSPPPQPSPDDGGGSFKLRRRSEKVPLVARDIEEDGDLAVGLGARRLHEGDPRRDHALVGRAEIIDLQEKADAAGELVADDALLLFAVRPGDQDAGRGTWRAHDHPPLGPSVIGERGDILDEVEAEYADEEVDGRVVFLHDESDEAQMRHQPSAPDFLSASISAAANPASRRISSLCWPTAGGGPAFRGLAKPSRIGLFTVRGTSGLVGVGEDAGVLGLLVLDHVGQPADDAEGNAGAGEGRLPTRHRSWPRTPASAPAPARATRVGARRAR